ncbi:MAG: hypothetical protein CMA64_04495, partial [Euryarchaeota archaeon]|nr:hypothetical protein [Euryarchaeota archaeon]
YLWKISAAAISRKATHDIATADWSTAVIAAQFVVGSTGTNAKTVKLTANKYAIPFTEAGTESTDLEFTATPQGLAGTGTYKFEVDSGSGFVQKQAASTDNTYDMNQGDEPASGDAHVVKVTMYDDGTEVANDSVSVYGVQDGSDALTVVFTNEAHTLPAANNGTVTSYTGSGTDIRVFKGATLLTAATSGTTVNTFKVSAVASTAVVSGSTVNTIAVSSTTGAVTNVLGGTPTNETIRYADHSAMQQSLDTASITYTITVYTAAGTTTVTKVQSFSKSTKGDTGATPTVEDGNDAARIVTGYLYWAGEEDRTFPEAGNPVTQTSPFATLVNGKRYKIVTPGNTNWTQIGAANSNAGTLFTYNNTTATGSGTVLDALPELNGTTAFTFGGGLSDTSFNLDIGSGFGATWAPGTTYSTSRFNWSIQAQAATGTRTKTFYVPFTATETVTNGNAQGTGSVTFGTIQEGISFSGLVTFTNLSTSGQTTINGANISTGTVDTEKINVGVKNRSVSRLLLLDDSLKIFEQVGGADKLRVHLGNLTNAED